jgi:hypothetical protein
MTKENNPSCHHFSFFAGYKAMPSSLAEAERCIAGAGDAVSSTN